MKFRHLEHLNRTIRNRQAKKDEHWKEGFPDSANLREFKEKARKEAHKNRKLGEFKDGM